MFFLSSKVIITWALFFRDVVFTVLIVVSLFLSVLWISVFIYGSFYFFYMPSQTYEIPLNFRFDPCDPANSEIGVKCSFLETEVDFQPQMFSKEFRLLPGQSYVVSLEIILPPTESNERVGMFMSCMDFKDGHGDVVTTKCASSMMEFRSTVARTLRTLVTYPFKMFVNSLEKSVINVVFFNNYQDDVHRPSKGASLVIKNRFIDIYEARLKIHAHFRGLRYFMYHFPVMSSFLGASMIGIFISSALAVTWKRVFEPSVVVKAELFTDRQERAKIALNKSQSQMRLIQRIRSQQELNEDSTLEEIDDPSTFHPVNDLSNQTVSEDPSGGIDISFPAENVETDLLRHRHVLNVRQES